ncbi:unnamed protein product [Amoebophrya sp. A25]|nr:unnamed protein product [Amoebophrya sp. A25]|eukprot:GSA25T00021641001.1
MSGERLDLQLHKLTDRTLAYTNLVYVNPSDFSQLAARDRRPTVYVLVKDSYPFSLASHPDVPAGKIYLSSLQRDFAQIPLEAVLPVVSWAPSPENELATARVNVDVIGGASGSSSKPEVDSKTLQELLLQSFRGQPFSRGQMCCAQLKREGQPTLALKFTFADVENKYEIMRAAQGKSPRSRSGSSGAQRIAAVLSPSSLDSVDFKSGPSNSISVLSSDMRRQQVFKKDFNFGAMGIGGLSQELETIFRKAFASRLYPPALIRQLGIKHVRGMMLYGPPGTGKTTIARQLGKCLDAREPIVKSGPEMLNMYVGEGERQIRELFQAAEEEQTKEGENSELHIIIIDEIDAICKQRGSSRESSGSLDSMVNQLLAKIDGVNALNNILLIGMTNRLDMIDEALLRPGRLEVKMEIGLPSEAGRQEILHIHTGDMRKNKRIASDVDLVELAGMTKNYSGAELEGVVRMAVSFSLARQIDFDNLGKELSQDDMKNLVVTRQDFLRGVQEVVPIYGNKDADFKRTIEFGMVEYSKAFTHLRRTLRLLIGQVRGKIDTVQSPRSGPKDQVVKSDEATGLQLSSVLLSGNPKSGKTALACHLIKEANFPFVRFLSAENFIGMGELSKMNYINKVFEDAYKTDMSCVIIDDIEALMEYVPVGQRFSNTVFQGLKQLISKKPTEINRRMFIFATTNAPEFVRNFELDSSFNYKFDVPDLQKPTEKEEVLKMQAGFDEDPKAVKECVEAAKIDLGVKRLILNAKLAKFKADTENINLVQAFLETLTLGGY